MIFTLFLFSIFLVATSLLISTLNFFTMRVTTDNNGEIVESVSILIPMRNEESNVRGILDSVLAMSGLTTTEVVVLNDNSEDQTTSLLHDFKDRIRIIEGKPLPAGWLGKPFACHQLARGSKSEYLVFLDADVRPSPLAISSSITLMNKLGWDFISPYPAQQTPTFLMRLIQPLLQWSWFASVPLRLAERQKFSSMVIANGQFFIVRRSAYEAIGGHEAVKNQVLEDLSLARTLSTHGYKGGVADASQLIECTMYETNNELITGYTKSLWKAFGGKLGTFATVSLLLLTQIIPLTLIFAGHLIAIFLFLSTAMTHLLASLKTRSGYANVLLHPIAALLLITLICESYRRKSQGRLEWRGRRVI